MPRENNSQVNSASRTIEQARTAHDAMPQQAMADRPVIAPHPDDRLSARTEFPSSVANSSDANSNDTTRNGDPRATSGGSASAGNVQVHPTIPLWLARLAAAMAAVNGGTASGVLREWLVAHVKNVYPDSVPSVVNGE